MISDFIALFNDVTRHPLVNKFFKWTHPIMIYGSFFLPLFLLFTHDFRVFGSIAWASLIVIMVLRPLSTLLPGILLLKKLMTVRRGIGIVSGMAALTHGLGYFYLYPSEISASSTWSTHQFYLYGIIALVFSTLLLVTSNNISVRFLGKRWKWLQKGVYGMFYVACIHVALMGHRGIDYTPIILGLGVFLLRFAAWQQTRTSKAHGGKNIEVL